MHLDIDKFPVQIHPSIFCLIGSNPHHSQWLIYCNQKCFISDCWMPALICTNGNDQVGGLRETHLLLCGGEGGFPLQK